MLSNMMLHKVAFIVQGVLCWLLEGGSKSVQALFNGIETVVVLTLIILK